MFAEIFIDNEGLDIIAKMLQRLPNGVLPNPTFRGKVFNMILGLPIDSDSLQRTSLGKTITVIEKCGEEIDSNLRLIREIKEKWSRIMCKVRLETKNEDSKDYLQERIKGSKTFTPNHILDHSQITTNYQNIEASQVRRMRRRYDFVLAPKANVEIEHHEKPRVE